MYGLPGGVGTCNMNQILYGTILSLMQYYCALNFIGQSIVRYLKIPEICLRYRKSIVVVKWMEIKFSMFLNFFDVISIFFRCFVSMFSLSMFCLFRVFAFLFLRSMFRHRPKNSCKLAYIQTRMHPCMRAWRM